MRLPCDALVFALAQEKLRGNEEFARAKRLTKSDVLRLLTSGQVAERLAESIGDALPALAEQGAASVGEMSAKFETESAFTMALAEPAVRELGPTPGGREWPHIAQSTHAPVSRWAGLLQRPREPHRCAHAAAPPAERRSLSGSCLPRRAFRPLLRWQAHPT